VRCLLPRSAAMSEDLIEQLCLVIESMVPMHA